MPQLIVANPSMREFFEEAVETALEHHALSADEATAAYLVDLLCEYARTREDPFTHPLAWVVATASPVALCESLDQLKQVGDHSLYVAGYCGESLSRLQLDLDYLVTVGGSAYRKLSRLLRVPTAETQLVLVFSELGDEFSQFVRVLDDVRRIAN